MYIGICDYAELRKADLAIAEIIFSIIILFLCKLHVHVNMYVHVFMRNKHYY